VARPELPGGPARLPAMGCADGWAGFDYRVDVTDQGGVLHHRR